MPSELQQIRDELAALRAEIAPPRKPKHSRRKTMLNFRLTPEEIAMLDAAAEAAGQCRSAFVRDALSRVLPKALHQPPEVPPQFRKRRKLSHFDDGKSPPVELSAADRVAVAKRAARLQYEAREVMAEAGLAPATADQARARQGKLSDAPLRSSLKPSR